LARIITNYGGLLLAAMGQTLLLALCGLFFACILGLVFGILSVLKNRACNIIATVFVDIIRGVPMIVLAFYVYFAVPMLLNNILHLNTMLGMKADHFLGTTGRHHLSGAELRRLYGRDHPCRY